MVVRIAGERMYLWRSVDHQGEVPDTLVQRRRDTPIGNDGVKPSYSEIAPGAANAAGQSLTQYGTTISVLSRSIPGRFALSWLVPSMQWRAT
jgi:DDE domain